MGIASTRTLWRVTLLLFLALLTWDSSDLDMVMALWSGSSQGFALRNDFLLRAVFHEGGRWASWIFMLWLCLGVWWPTGWLVRIDARQRLQLATTSLAAVISIATLKSGNPTSCPWDLAEFGRTARHLSHWTFAHDGGGGHCFPAGHASSGFAFMAGYFAFRKTAPVLARVWLAIAITAGLVLGVAQQARGAHFMSHTLWTGWLCWLIALLIDHAWPTTVTSSRPAQGDPGK